MRNYGSHSRCNGKPSLRMTCLRPVESIDHTSSPPSKLPALRGSMPLRGLQKHASGLATGCWLEQYLGSSAPCDTRPSFILGPLLKTFCRENVRVVLYETAVLRAPVWTKHTNLSARHLVHLLSVCRSVPPYPYYLKFYLNLSLFFSELYYLVPAALKVAAVGTGKTSRYRKF